MINLTKTDFKEYLICNKCLWLKKKRPEDYVEGEFSAFLKKLIKDGYEVEDYFQKLFLDGVSVTGNREELIKKTKELIESKQTIFQATFETEDGRFAKIDILEFDRESESWNLYEVKAGSSIKTDLFHNHIKDITFQKVVLEKSGIEVGKSFIVHLNKEYVRKGEIDLRKLFVINEVSGEIDSVKKEVEEEIQKALDLFKMDDVDTRGCECIYKSHGQQCDGFRFFNPEIPEYSTAHIFRGKKLEALVNDNIFHIQDVPDDFKTTENQKTKIDLHKNNLPKIDTVAIQETLSELVYPLYFLDYETFGKPIPVLDGYKPSQQLVFQYSLHVLQEDGRLKHFEYLAEDLENATSGLVASLKNHIGSVGNVVVWNESFEKSRNVELMELHSEYRDFLEDVNSRVFDLMKVFKKDYLHPEFKGSASIKKVLPILVPELSYDDLDVQNGTMAIEAWGKTIFDNVSPDEKEKVRNDLLKYCELDTLAMVEIFRKLKE
jgi:CRISPR/Cas system-associated exonuclease Cas4 (RecB family)